MRDNAYIVGWVPAGLLALVCFTAVLLSAGDSFADNVSFKPSVVPDPALSDAETATPPPPGQHPRISESKPFLALRPSVQTAFTTTDQLTALENVQVALVEVADGSKYVWHRNNGNLSGIVQPLRSFKGGDGEVCRELVVLLRSHQRSRTTRTTACRTKGGLWRLQS